MRDRDSLHESPYKPRDTVKDNRDLKPVNLATQYYNREPLKPAFVTTTGERVGGMFDRSIRIMNISCVFN